MDNGGYCPQKRIKFELLLQIIVSSEVSIDTAIVPCTVTAMPKPDKFRE